MGTPNRLVATTLLVLIALGGAGLAVAADRIEDPTNRPEVTWAADHAAQPYIDSLAADLSNLGPGATDLAKAGRDTLGNLQALNLDTVRAAIEAGDAASTRVGGALATTNADHARATSTVERWRLGRDSAAQLDAIDKAVASAGDLPSSWDVIRTRAAVVAGLVDDLQRHDGLVFRATTAGRQQDWAAALTTLGEADTALDEARTARTSLVTGATVDTLDQLIDRYAAYDSALSALYSYFGSGGGTSGATFDTLQRQVDDAQALLPSGSSVFSLIVGEAAGTAITDALVKIEQARGYITAALLATSGTTAASAATP